MHRSNDMLQHTRLFGLGRFALPSAVLAAAALALALGAAAPGGDDDDDDDVIPLAAATMIIEINGTDGDSGIQIFLDGEPWKQIEVEAPDGRNIFKVQGKGNLKKLGLTELFFESEEPSFDDLPLEELFEMFPEGEYEFSGVSTEGDELEGVAWFTHDVPDTPIILMPLEDEVVDPDNVVIMWAPTPDPPGSAIVGFQVIVVQEDPHREFSVHLPGTSTSVSVAPEFFLLGAEYTFEVLAIETSGNQTIAESAFSTMP